MAYSLNFVYYTKFLYKIKQAGKQASKQMIYFKQAKQASSRYQKLQASKLRLLSLACLLITNQCCIETPDTACQLKFKFHSLLCQFYIKRFNTFQVYIYKNKG